MVFSLWLTLFYELHSGPDSDGSVKSLGMPIVIQLIPCYTGNSFPSSAVKRRVVLVVMNGRNWNWMVGIFRCLAEPNFPWTFIDTSRSASLHLVFHYKFRFLDRLAHRRTYIPAWSLLLLWFLDTSVDDATCRSYLSCVSALQLLAKFLGLVTFLPYKSRMNVLPEDMVALQSAVRAEVRLVENPAENTCDH